MVCNHPGMTGLVTRYLIIALLTLGIVLPQASAALAGLGLLDGRLIVICTGDGLRTIRINDDGEPVETAQKVDLCALVHAADTSERALPAAIAPRYLFTTGKTLAGPVSLTAHFFSPSLPRGPPLA